MASEAAKKAAGSVDSLTSKIDALLVNAKQTRRRSGGADRLTAASSDAMRSGTPNTGRRPDSAGGDRSLSPAQAGLAPTPTPTPGGTPAPEMVAVRFSSSLSASGEAGRVPSPAPAPAAGAGGAATAGGAPRPPLDQRGGSSGGSAAAASGSSTAANATGLSEDDALEVSPRSVASAPSSTLDELIELAGQGGAPGGADAGAAGGAGAGIMLVTGPDGGVVAVRTMGASYAVQVRGTRGGGLGWK